jgi:hypothetical protein
LGCFAGSVRLFTGPLLPLLMFSATIFLIALVGVFSRDPGRQRRAIKILGMLLRSRQPEVTNVNPEPDVVPRSQDRLSD